MALNEEKAWEICMDIYREMYKNSEPPADFDKLIESGEAKKEMFFSKYHLDDNIQHAIIKKHLDKNKITRRFERDKIECTIDLGCSPCSCGWKNPDHKRL